VSAAGATAAAIRDAESVRMIRLGGRAERANPLDRSEYRFLGFEVRESSDLSARASQAIGHALGRFDAYACDGGKAPSNVALLPVQIGFEFRSKDHRIRLVLFQPEEEVEIEMSNGREIRVALSGKGGDLWWEAMRTILRPETGPLAFYAYMRAARDSVIPNSVRDTLGAGPETDLELDLVALTKVVPEYPDLARAAGVDGDVQIHALVGPDGRVHGTKVIKSIPMLDDAARRAVQQWRFEPGMKDGKPVWAWTSVPVRFSLH
jgi:protein TonB